MNSSSNSIQTTEDFILTTEDSILKEVIIIVSYSLVGLFGCLTNLTNVVIFSDKKFKDKIFQYLFYHSLSELFYLLLVPFSLIHACMSTCKESLSKSFIANIILLYNTIYFTSCLAIFAIFLEVTISFQRYLVVSNSRFCGIIKNGSPRVISSFLLVLALIFYLPELINYRIIKYSAIPGLYTLKKAYKSKVYDYYVYMVLLTRGPISTLVLTLINSLTLVKFRKQMDKKKMIKNGGKFSFYIIV
jgi:hypothetical protein